MKQIKHIFFDLDRTLWDFESNSKTVLKILYRDYNLSQFFAAFPLFFKHYKKVNEQMWQQYYKKEITKDEVRLLRFYNTIGEDKQMCAEISQNYIEMSVMQTAVFPHTYETLTALRKRGYTLHIITNGFTEVQHKKLRNSKLDGYFQTVTTSEDAQHHKPDTRSFEFALQQAATTASHAAMVGDDLITDIQGANDAGMLSIYFNPNRYTTPHKADKEIQSLESLLQIF